jgi:tetratricopeptide (TPR) repeat protein
MSKIIRLIVVLMLMVACAHAANLTVCQNGCDHTNIQAAIYAAKNNDTIELHSGTYNGSAILTKELKFVGKDTGSGEPLVMGDLYTSGYRYSLRGFGFNQIKINPSSYSEATDSLYYWMGKEREYYSAKSYAKALEAISNALKLDPQNAVAWNLKGICLDAQGRRDEAIECYDNAIKIDPSGSNPLGNKGADLYFLGEYENANSYYDQAINADPRYIGYLSMKALVLSKMAKFDDALMTIDKAIGLQPQNADYWSTKSAILFSWGKFDDALTAIDKSIDLKPSQNLFWQIKGNILQTMGRNTEADAAFAKAKELGYSG